ncbi:hypothetical protein GGX14DRAFT_400056 [Mycena pura]|uniref:HNH nuclease domain-containing protein n=1 Tax=Mycena pura TaxID=153505 RepID=A0AAD6V6R8_9AGAR|nr:hypothetical protein GGX14DRAFT_400056 [Mycena pura]
MSCSNGITRFGFSYSHHVAAGRISPRSPSTRLYGLTSLTDILFLHPRTKTRLLTFSAFPTIPNGSHAGFPVGIVLNACYVVAGNRRVQLLVVLGEVIADVQMHLPRRPPSCSQHPITFWSPERLAAPDLWRGHEAKDEQLKVIARKSESDVSTSTKTLDTCCLVTGAVSGVRASHLVPMAERPWWESHIREITAFGHFMGDLNSIYNEITLRGDLDVQVFDQGEMLLAPFEEKIVTLVLSPTAEDLAYEHHFQTVNLPSRIRRAYLFIRFAWNIMKFNAQTLTYTESRPSLDDDKEDNMDEGTGSS